VIAHLLAPATALAQGAEAPPLAGNALPWPTIGAALLVLFAGGLILVGRRWVGRRPTPPAPGPRFPRPDRPVGPLRLWSVRGLIALNLVLASYYLGWRYLYSINWSYWPIALALIAAESYSYVDAWLFGLTMWRWRQRGEPPAPPEGATVDVFITCYNEPVELVRETARAAVAIRYPHRTYVLDDGSSPAMEAMAREEGAGYIVRSADWVGRQRHAKAGNLNNALAQTTGEFLLILDADQIPAPTILDRVLGYFQDPRVAFVQTPQWFWNVPPSDPFGSQAPLFYGPIQQGKDGWNAAFFCGSNAVLRREALLQMGIRHYVRVLEQRVRRALTTAGRLLAAAEREVGAGRAGDDVAAALRATRAALGQARRDLRGGTPIQQVTWQFQRSVESISRELVMADLTRMRADVAAVRGIDPDDLTGSFEDVLDDPAALEEAVQALTGRESSPLVAIGAVRELLLAVDVDRQDEAQAIMPMSTISVTEDMATAMRLHAMGWRSVYHHEVLAIGLAPEDLRSTLQQRLRWAQGTIQVLLRENPLVQSGLSLGQRLMYFATMWNYFSGLFAVVYLTSPILFVFFGWLPVRAFSLEFFQHLLPFLIVNQLLFVVVGWGRSTWRGQQYSLALFPLWIRAVWTAGTNVYLGRKLGFVVTPKIRQSGVYLGLVRWQLVTMAALAAAVAFGLARLALGLTDDGLPILVNVFWAIYDLVMLSAVLDAVTYRPPEDESDQAEPTLTAAEAHGRVLAGGK
jgi:cellulose synthase (UDP-forming)